MSVCLVFNGSGDEYLAEIGSELRQQEHWNLCSEFRNNNQTSNNDQNVLISSIYRQQYYRYVNLTLSILFIGGGKIQLSNQKGLLSTALQLISFSPLLWLQLNEDYLNDQIEQNQQMKIEEKVLKSMMDLVSGNSKSEFWYTFIFDVW